MSVPNGALLRATARFNAGGYGDSMNVFNLECVFTTPQSEEDVFDAVDAYLSSVYADFDEYMASTLNPADLKVDVVAFQAGEWKVTANVGFGSWGSTLNTAETSDVLPPGSAVLIKLRTALGKHYGRKFVGWFTELMNGNGFPTSTLTAAIVTGFAKLLSAHVFNTSEGIRGVVLDTVTGTARQMLEVAVGGQWSYQRRRRPGVGS